MQDLELFILDIVTMMNCNLEKESIIIYQLLKND